MAGASVGSAAVATGVRPHGQHACAEQGPGAPGFQGLQAQGGEQRDTQMHREESLHGKTQRDEHGQLRKQRRQADEAAQAHDGPGPRAG